MTTSVVVIVANRAEHLVRLVAGLVRGDRQPSEVVIVDMGSDDDPRRAVAAASEDLTIRWVTCTAEPASGRLPLAAARNLGAALACADRLIFLDVDCIPAADLIGAYEAAIDLGGLVCGPVRYLERFWTADLDLDEPSVDDELRYRSEPNPARPQPERERLGDDHELFWSLAFGLDRATWDRIGGFDESYVGYGGEDTDFGFRARSCGVPLRWIERGVAFHQWHDSASPPLRHLDAIIDNALRFRQRWGTWPMAGWLRDLRARGLVSWDPDSGELRRLD